MEMMRMSEDLDWLARNVHEWTAGDHQPWCYIYQKDGERKVSGNCITVIQPCVKIDRGDWLARRAELQNKPSWADAPDWATHLIQTMAGLWLWLSHKPNGMDDDGVMNFRHDARSEKAIVGEVLGDWRDTLERRPEPFQPFTSIEGNQEQSMQQDNGWFEIGLVPPIGRRCEICHKHWNAGDFQQVTILSITSEYLIVKDEYREQHYRPEDISFRPIRMEREKSIDSIVEVFIDYHGDPKGAERYIGIANALHKAGYRKEHE